MRCWLLKLNTNIFSSDGDIYACTHSAWPSISKFIVLLLEECWGSNSHRNEYSGLLKGYVCIEGFRYVWFAHNHSAGQSVDTLTQFSEGCAPTRKNILIWFYLPREYRQFTQLYVDLKHVLVGRVPFKAITEEILLTHILSNETANNDLYLLTNDSEDLLFYCVQSQHISVENIVTTNQWNSIENSAIAEFPRHPFRCISVCEVCNIQADQVPILSQAVIGGDVAHNSIEDSDDLNLSFTSAHTDEYVDETLERIKEDPDDDCERNVKKETQHNPEEQQLTQPQEITRHDHLPTIKEGRRKGTNSEGGESMSYTSLLNISKSYGKLAASKLHATRKLWGGLSTCVGPTLVLQCPSCGKMFPPSNPKSLWNMLIHMKRKHMRDIANLRTSISDELDVLIPFMQKKISVWTKRKVYS